MTESPITTRLSQQLREFWADYVRSFGDPSALHGLSEQWRELASQIGSLLSTGQLDSSIADLARRVAFNIALTARGVTALEVKVDQHIDDLTTQMGRMWPLDDSAQPVNINPSTKRDSSTALELPSVPTQRRKPSSLYPCAFPSSSISPSPSPCNSLAPLRRWFLDNIASPFLQASDVPTISERTSLSFKQMNTYLTNWRRRSGWTHFRETYASRSRDGAEVLITRLIAVEQGEPVEPLVASKTLLHLGLWDNLPEEIRKNIKGSRRCKVDLGGRLKLGYTRDEEDDMLHCLADIRKYMKKDNEAVGQWIRKVVEAAPRSLSTSSSSSSISTVSDVSERLRSVSGWSTPEETPKAKTPKAKTPKAKPTPKTYNWKIMTADYFTFGQDTKTFEPDLPLYEHGVASWNEI